MYAMTFNCFSLPADVVGAESDAIRVIAPISIGLSQFHFLLLYRDRLKAVSKLNDELVFEKQLPPVPCFQYI
jgi:vacuolar protein sorting-associated protein 18